MSKSVERIAPIVTLTSDFGRRDYYLALIKGRILSHAPQATLVDISHDIETFNIVQAAFLFKHAWSAFPTGTIHLLSINDFGVPDRPFLVFSHEGHFFVGPDNGLFSLIFPSFPQQCYAIETEELASNFPIAEIYGKAVGHLAQNFPPGGLGKAVEEWTERLTLQPVIGPNHIRGSIVYVDQFKNAIINIDRQLFTEVGNDRPFQLFFKRHSPISSLATHYHDVPVGEILCRFNSAMLLEIAINMGEAAQLLGLKVEDTVQVDFSTVKKKG